MNSIGYSLSLLKKLADDRAGGHYTILSFTTGFKVALGTPQFAGENLESYFKVQVLPQFPTLEEAVEYALFNPDKANFSSDWLESEANQKKEEFQTHQ